MLANWITLSRFPILMTTVLALYLGSPSGPPGRGGAPLRRAHARYRRWRRGPESRTDQSVRGRTRHRRRPNLRAGAVGVLRRSAPHPDGDPAGRPRADHAHRRAPAPSASAGARRPFAQHRTRLGRFLVGSSWMRTAYAVAKIATFCGLALVQACADFPPESAPGRRGRAPACPRFVRPRGSPWSSAWCGASP